MNHFFNREQTSFNSLYDCIEYLRHRFPSNQSVNISCGKDIETGAPVTVKAPAFLYRGESSAYPESKAAMSRLKECVQFPLAVRNLIERLTQEVDTQLQEFLELNPMLSAGFIQHYGMPTELLDVTSDLDVAGFLPATAR